LTNSFYHDAESNERDRRLAADGWSHVSDDVKNGRGPFVKKLTRSTDRQRIKRCDEGGSNSTKREIKEKIAYLT
jgi:hypothetical protein